MTSVRNLWYLLLGARWELRAKEAPDHIKDAWPGSAWIVELITTTTKRNGKRRDTRHYYGLRPTASTSRPCGPPQKPCYA